MNGTTEHPSTRPALGATAGHLLALIRSRPTWTRQQLLEATGMSRPTLQDRLAPLFAGGLVHAAGVGASVGGRPAELIRFDDRHLVVLTFDVGHTHCRVSVTGVRGKELRSVDAKINITHTPAHDAITTMLDMARRLTSARRSERLIGVGFGVPGPIAPRTGLPGPTLIMPGWEDYPLLDRLRARWDVPVIAENDARALALGEATLHENSTVLGVKWASGIGAGLVAGGQSLSGDDGAAGDIGHIKLSAGGPVCRCGRRGCLAAYSSGYALLGQLRRAGVENLDDVTERARTGDRQTGAALVAAARRVGTVLAALIALTNPRTLVLGGVIGSLPIVVDAVAARVRHVTLHRSTDALQILPSQLGERAATAGLVHLVVERVLSSDAVDRALAAGTNAFGKPASIVIR